MVLLILIIFLLRKSLNPVIIDNTNVLYIEFKPYIDIANRYDYIILICEPRTTWKFNANELFGN